MYIYMYYNYIWYSVYNESWSHNSRSRTKIKQTSLQLLWSSDHVMDEYIYLYLGVHLQEELSVLYISSGGVYYGIADCNVGLSQL